VVLVVIVVAVLRPHQGPSLAVPERPVSTHACQGFERGRKARGLRGAGRHARAPWPRVALLRVAEQAAGSSACSGSLEAMVALVLEARAAVGSCGEAAVSDPTVHLPLAWLPHAMSPRCVTKRTV
jgi:hypothetical protein